MRSPITITQLLSSGYTPDLVRGAVARGELQRACRGVYLIGAEPPTWAEASAAVVAASGGVACGRFAGHLHRWDEMSLTELGPVATPRNSRLPGTHRRAIDPARITVVQGVRCTDAVQTLVDLAGRSSADEWEWALESALRRGADLRQIERAVATMGGRRLAGAATARDVVLTRPHGAPATESWLETCFLQLLRRDPRIPTPLRQVLVRNAAGQVIARVDYAWPWRGAFVEVNGRHHDAQQLHDDDRFLGVVAATGWRGAEVRSEHILRTPTRTLRRVADLVLGPLAAAA